MNLVLPDSDDDDDKKKSLVANEISGNDALTPKRCLTLESSFNEGCVGDIAAVFPQVIV